MKAEFINPFIEASTSVLKKVCGVDSEIGKIYLKNSLYRGNQIIIIIGLTGKLNGQVQFNMDKETAMKIASSMMGGMEVETLDQMALSAISELGNMIMGNTSTLLYNRAINIDITPPSILTGDSMEVSNKINTLCIPIKLGDIGNIEIGIAAEEK
ncbi:MAG: chemotaxis protein CheX [Clostridia bacterium]|nr:chemotaxis protein CheX [Clostridia bacterium]